MAMLRIFKHYEFNLQQLKGVASRKLSFSSYPGEGLWWSGRSLGAMNSVWGALRMSSWS